MMIHPQCWPRGPHQQNPAMLQSTSITYGYTSANAVRYPKAYPSEKSKSVISIHVQLFQLVCLMTEKYENLFLEPSPEANQSQNLI